MSRLYNRVSVYACVVVSGSGRVKVKQGGRTCKRTSDMLMSFFTRDNKYLVGTCMQVMVMVVVGGWVHEWVAEIMAGCMSG